MEGVSGRHGKANEWEWTGRVGQGKARQGKARQGIGKTGNPFCFIRAFVCFVGLGRLCLGRFLLLLFCLT